MVQVQPLLLNLMQLLATYTIRAQLLSSSTNAMSRAVNVLYTMGYEYDNNIHKLLRTNFLLKHSIPRIMSSGHWVVSSY